MCRQDCSFRSPSRRSREDGPLCDPARRMQLTDRDQASTEMHRAGGWFSRQVAATFAEHHIGETSLVDRAGASHWTRSFSNGNEAAYVACPTLSNRIARGYLLPEFTVRSILGGTVLLCSVRVSAANSMRAASAAFEFSRSATWRDVITCPPVSPSEQHAMVAGTLIRKPSAIISGLKGQTRRTVIERLQEYRTALITAAVTGKIDVREAAQAPAAAVRRK